MVNDGNQSKLEETECERDLGVYISNTLKATHHCRKAAGKAMSALRLLKIAFGTLTESNFKLLYTVYVRPHLEYCIQAVGPHMVQDLQTLEKVQRRATRLVMGFNGLSYEERLRKLKLTTLKERFERGDFIETYKLLTRKLKIDPTQFFQENVQGRTRGHPLKLKVRRAKRVIRAKVFSNRIVTTWNKLPPAVVSAASTNQFKNKLDKYLASKMATPHP